MLGLSSTEVLTFGALPDHLRERGGKKWRDNPRAHGSAAGPRCSPGSRSPHLRAPHGSTQSPRVAEQQDSAGQVCARACVSVWVGVTVASWDKS